MESKITWQKKLNVELRLQFQILSDMNFQEEEITGVVGVSFKEEGSTWSELVS